MLSKIFTQQFFFASNLAFSRVDKILAAAFAAMLVLAAIFWTLALLQKKSPIVARLYRRFIGGLVIFGFFGGLWVALRFLFIPILGTRFAIAVVMAAFLFWLYFPLKYLFFKFSRERKQWAEQQLKNRYLKST